MKTLSQMLEELMFVEYKDYEKLKQVAIELAKACETTAIMDNDCGRWCRRSLSCAKDIIGDKDEN